MNTRVKRTEYTDLMVDALWQEKDFAGLLVYMGKVDLDLLHTQSLVAIKILSLIRQSNLANEGREWNVGEKAQVQLLKDASLDKILRGLEHTVIDARSPAKESPLEQLAAMFAIPLPKPKPEPKQEEDTNDPGVPAPSMWKEEVIQKVMDEAVVIRNEAIYALDDTRGDVSKALEHIHQRNIMHIMHCAQVSKELATRFLAARPYNGLVMCCGVLRGAIKYIMKDANVDHEKAAKALEAHPEDPAQAVAYAKTL